MVCLKREKGSHTLDQRKEISGLGYCHRMSKSGQWIVSMKSHRVEENGKTTKLFFKVPKSIKPELSELWLELRETGGLTDQFGHFFCTAEVICGVQGDMFQAYRSSNEKLGPHAYFCKKQAVRVRISGKEIFITEINIDFTGDEVVVVENLLFSGKRLNRELIRFHSAVKMAKIKANCKNCQHTHFAILPV